jgi:hypothetical protein
MPWTSGLCATLALCGVAVVQVLANQAGAQGQGAGLRRPWLANLPFNQFPMLQSHDAGTGYLNYSTGDPVTDIINRFTKTQEEPITGQLDCGARAFDWRPYLDPATEVWCVPVGWCAGGMCDHVCATMCVCA